MKSLLTAVYNRLVAITDGGSSNPLRDSVGNRIYQIEAPASSALPLVVFALTEVSVTHSFGGREHVTGTLNVSVIGKTENGVAALADIESEVFTLLDLIDTAGTGYDRVHFRTTERGVPVVEGEYLRLDSSLELVAHSTS